MKKPVIKKEVVPIGNKNVIKAGSKTAGGIINILNKLEPQQLLDLADKVTTLGQSYFEYGKECERTKQTAIHATVRIREIDAELETKYLEHEKNMAQIQLDDRIDNRQFEKDMEGIGNQANELEKRDKQIHRIFDLLEAGKVSENTLADLIYAIKQ